jgi:hypothetical protein
MKRALWHPAERRILAIHTITAPRKRPDTVANLPQSSRSTLSWDSVLSFFAFKEGMLRGVV